MKRNVSLLLLVLGAGLAALLFSRMPRNDVPAEPVSPEVRGAAQPRVADKAEPFSAFAAQPAPIAPRQPVQLPPVDTLPVRELLATLDERARRGDVQAACRLANELLRCRSIARWNERALQYQIETVAGSKLTGAALERRTRELAAIEDHNLAVRERCAGVTKEELRRIPRYAFVGAQRDHVPSMLLFADAVGMSGEDIVADPEFYAAYRAHAWPMFRRAFEAGHPRAVAAWSWALNSNGFRFLGGVLPEDWKRPGLALALLTRVRADLAPGNDRSLAQPPSTAFVKPTDAEQAEAEALYTRHFADSPWMRTLADTAPPDNPQSDGYKIDENACLEL